ncbi:MAG: glucuronate isomerase [Ruminococcaceae bacterium]|nr:glucuronate isomerase [Oscillospiraceae bacterium]
MKEFLGKDFLLDSATASELYYGYAEKMPIYDFHCHLNPREIYEDKQYRSLTEVWLAGDHYKWRLLREFGVDERYITGDASDEEKFREYARVMPYAIGNPIYSWTHLELRRFFGIEDVLTPETADKIYAEANEKLKTLTARQLIKMSNVRGICTTDDPVDSLEYHIMIEQDPDFDVKVRPSFRPDKAMKIDQATFLPWIADLEKAVGYPVPNFATLKKALLQRAYFFDAVGCVVSDHGLDTFEYLPSTEEECEVIFAKALRSEALTADEVEKYKGALLIYLGKVYNELGWAQQYHIGALRNNSERCFKLLGPDTGYDAINDQNFAPKLSAVLSELDKTGELPKTVLYCLNPRDNETLAALMNCFQGGTPGKIQFGSGWWFNDQKDGMQRQMETLMQVGLISQFVGMLTDSRSFLSYTRHEYFRRILCSKLGALIEGGEYPADLEFVGKIVEDICYNNAMRYFAK